MDKTHACVQFQDKLYGIMSHCRKMFAYFVWNNYGCVEIFKKYRAFLTCGS